MSAAKYLLNLKSLDSLHLKLDIVACEQISEECFLVNDSYQSTDHVVGVICVAFLAHDAKISLVEAF